MANQSSDSHSGCSRRESSGAGLRAGMAKDQLIFIIICAVAVTVATVTLVRSFSPGSKVRPGAWQCVACDNEFEAAASPPPKCPKCGGRAVRLVYRDCRSCGKKVLVCRIHVPEAPEGATGPGGGPPGLGMMMQPMPMQYWVKQEDGSFAWSSMVMGGSPQAIQLERSLICPECG